MRTRIVSAFAVAVLASAVFAAPAFSVGKPVAPGSATAEGFLPSSGCTCHPDLLKDWQGTMHAKAIVDPVFLLKANEAKSAAGDGVATFCKRCHSPVGNMLGDVDGKSNAVAAEGVTCMYCHQVTGMQGTGNTSHLILADLTRRAQIKDPAAPHPAVYSELHTKAEFCGGCHNVNHPTNGTHLESSYTEWLEGPYAKEGIVCQDCHMSANAGVVGPYQGQACSTGAQRDGIFSMTFIGANVGQGAADEAVALLESAATVEVDVPEIVPAGKTATVTVTVTNKGAGHYLPTGLTEVREMWLAVYAEGKDGERTELGEHRYGTALKDAAGKYPAEMWDAVAVQSDDRIPPRGTSVQDFEFAMPEDGNVARVVAVLNYRSLPDDLAEKAAVDNPTTEMASGSRSVFVSEEAKDAAAKPAGSDADKVRSPLPYGMIGLLALAILIGVVVAVSVAAKGKGEE